MKKSREEQLIDKAGQLLGRIIWFLENRYGDLINLKKKIGKWFKANWRSFLLPIIVTLLAVVVGLLIGIFIGSVLAFNALIGV